MKSPRVAAFCRDAKLASVCCDGCAFGVQSVALATKGLPIKEPWRVDTDMPELLETLNRKCTCIVQHTPCAGVDTRLTESYTDEMVAAIHHGVASQCKEMQLERFTPEVSKAQPAACAIGFAITGNEQSPGDAGGALRPTGRAPVKTQPELPPRWRPQLHSSTSESNASRKAGGSFKFLTKPHNKTRIERFTSNRGVEFTLSGALPLDHLQYRREKEASSRTTHGQGR